MEIAIFFLIKKLKKAFLTFWCFFIFADFIVFLKLLFFGNFEIFWLLYAKIWIFLRKIKILHFFDFGLFRKIDKFSFLNFLKNKKLDLSSFL